MLGTKEAFLIAALLCFVMFLVVYSVNESRVGGVRELLLGNVFGMAAYILYAFGKELPPLFAFEVANAAYISASAATLVGYRRLTGRAIHPPWIFALVAAVTASIALFHYVVDSFTLRTLVVSLSQAGIAAAIGLTVASKWRGWPSSRYPLLFIICMCAIIAGGHLFRSVAQLLDGNAPRSLLEPTGWNVLILSAGAFMLPVLTLGGLLLAHCTIVAVAEKAANHDFLTGAWSRRAFFDIGTRELERAKRSRSPLALLLIDLDNFKALNDACGHAAGDATLLRLASASAGALRSIDFLARLGGDEFAVLMPETRLDGALAAANRLLQQNPAADQLNSPVPVTLSIGLAISHDDDTLHSLMQRADKALYAAKAQGRNRLVAESSLFQARQMVES